jgi:hypothetical protein
MAFMDLQTASTGTFVQNVHKQSTGTFVQNVHKQSTGTFVQNVHKQGIVPSLKTFSNEASAISLIASLKFFPGAKHGFDIKISLIASLKFFPGAKHGFDIKTIQAF